MTDTAAIPTVHLQNYGLHRAKPAGELKAGDTMVFNFGITHKVESVRLKGKSVYAVLSSADGKVWPEKRYSQSTLVAVKGIQPKAA